MVYNENNPRLNHVVHSYHVYPLRSCRCLRWLIISKLRWCYKSRVEIPTFEKKLESSFTKAYSKRYLVMKGIVTVRHASDGEIFVVTFSTGILIPRYFAS